MKLINNQETRLIEELKKVITDESEIPSCYELLLEF